MTSLHRLLLQAGIAAPLVYLATVAVGGWTTLDYSHLGDPVSALFAAGAPHALPISAAFVLYNLLLLAFGAGLLLSFRNEPIALRIAALMVLQSGVYGIVIEAFPMDPMGAPATFAGIAHIVVAALLLFSTIAAMVYAVIGWLDLPEARGAALGTIGLLAIVLVFGALAALAATQGWPLLGLYQRITIGGYLVWLVAVAAALLSERTVLLRA